MKILITGGTGFLGKALVKYLQSLGHECLVISRNPENAGRVLPGMIAFSHKQSVPSVDVVINLAGESVVGLWTSRKKAAILESRANATRHLIDLMRGMKPLPKVFISASAIGYYGHRPGETLTEESSADPLQGFRFKVCSEWENAAKEAESLGVRTVLLRLSHILQPSGGFMKALIPYYRWGACVGLGAASAHFSWISLEDTVRLIDWLIAQNDIRGPVNASTPSSTKAGTFRDALAHALQRKPIGSLPNTFLKLMLGEFASALIEDQKIWPKKAEDQGFTFQHTDITQFMESLKLEGSIR
jgi:uncharacterized protein